MPVLTSSVEMNDLAQKLARMRFGRAKGTIRRLDRHARLDLFRVYVGNEWQTRFTLPGKGLWVTLVEVKEEFGAPVRNDLRKTRFRFVEARVEPIPEKVRDEMLRKGEFAPA